MTITEAAEYMEVTHWTIRRWIKLRLFPVTKINSKIIRIDKDDLDDFKKENKVTKWKY
jgi:excisionase family DNA binding protein